MKVPLAEVPMHRPHKTKRVLRRYVEEKRVPFFRIDGRIFFDLDDLDAHDNAGKVDARP
jgi:hypothetical protein